MVRHDYAPKGTTIRTHRPGTKCFEVYQPSYTMMLSCEEFTASHCCERQASALVIYTSHTDDLAS